MRLKRKTASANGEDELMLYQGWCFSRPGFWSGTRGECQKLKEKSSVLPERNYIDS